MAPVLPQVGVRDFSMLRLQLTGICGDKRHMWLLNLLEAALEGKPQATFGLMPAQAAIHADGRCKVCVGNHADANVRD